MASTLQADECDRRRVSEVVYVLSEANVIHEASSLREFQAGPDRTETSEHRCAKNTHQHHLLSEDFGF